MPDQHEIPPEEETSVWDYFVSKIKFWNRSESEPAPTKEEEKPMERRPFAWLSLAALVLALIAQRTLEPYPARTPWPGVILYFGALACLTLAVVRKEWHLLPLRSELDDTLRVTFRPEFLLMGIFFAIFAFLLFGNGLFGILNTSLWVLSLVFIFVAFWQHENKKVWDIKAFWRNFQSKGWKIRITRWSVILLAVIAVILFFNFYRLDSVPPEMVSDQAEKLMDIHDLLNGHTPVYFPRNTGREVLHFYLTAAYIGLFNLDVSFLNLKVVAVFANLLTVFFIYLLGKEFGNKWVGLAAALLAGIAYWPLLFTRLALRIPYYPLFVAPVLYFLIRGLRRQNINDILLTGLFLGLGLHGYTPFRIVPIFVVIGILIYVLHRPGRERRLGAIVSLLLIAFISLIVFLPLFRYWLANPEMFAYRAFSRLTGMEVGFQNHPVVVFFQNFWKASLMFFWDNGSIWAHSVPGRPALEVVSGALYFLGIAGLLIRYIRGRDWRDLFLLTSIPLLLMPSILSLAYPGENPSLNRTAGAVVPVFVVIGSALEAVIRTLRRSLPNRMGKLAVFLVVILLVIWSGANNFDLVFNQYDSIYRASSWNTSEIGRVAAFFIESLGSAESTYVVGYPHWVDSRLVAINAGYTGLDFAIFPEQLKDTAKDLRPKVFFLNVNDTESMKQLNDIFNNGTLTRYDSDVENKDFMIFFVPPAQGVAP